MALIMAGIRLFGENGFEATSTREIAASAKANIASIAYHFGSKDGLRLACAEFVGARIRDVLGPALRDLDPGDDPAAAQAVFEGMAMNMADFMLGRAEARDIAAFLLREMANPGVVFDRIYADFIFPVHSKLCTLLGMATGRDPESDLIRIGAFSIAGQVVYFRVGHAIVARRMGWETAGPEEIASIKSVIQGNIRAFVAANRKTSS
jgi:AcrR family transcriptional regulator